MTVNAVTYLIAIISYGPKRCKKAGEPAAFARVGAVAEWVVKNVQDGECANSAAGKKEQQLLNRVRDERRRGLESFKRLSLRRKRRKKKPKKKTSR